ncbi:energy-coupling factor transporter transmembrane component T [Evansella sp. AB-P1]|uniref:energy-coupling factor transporter transmembrane component T family protein n=1 Tax=Evansella sp. AB-P1 TaxID=3037653 RepID=UPI00241D7C20|nr:energy-coupling factor transporter transmembrane component T [Evansella sp. AB-P1]MDG5788084.1 energy-coupling factor transporter transmembrane component T [Evansella sp. AB-P1]
MLNNNIIGQYVPGDSYIHRMDPRAKLICIVLFMVFLFFSSHPLIIAIGLFITIVSFYLSQVPLRFFLKGMRLIGIIILFTFMMHLIITGEGSILFEVFFITIYVEGVIEGFIIAIRLLTLVTMASLLTLTTTSVNLADGMETLLRPLEKLRIPIHELAFMMSIALRFIPTLLGETRKITNAQISRGANFSTGSLIQRVKKFVSILVPLFVRSFKRAEDLAVAMEARGYTGGNQRTKFRKLQWGWIDTIAIIVFLLFSLLAITERFFS